jgi:hypothetical protein
MPNSLPATQFLLSPHAHVRLQQRGIPARVIELLLRYGARRHAGGAAVIHCIDNGARLRLQMVLDRTEYARLERHFGVYAVVSGDATVITAAHRRRSKHLQA